MARIRTVKPELFGHEDLFDAEREAGLPLRLAFIGLFTCCDREGRFKWRPRTLKKDVLPHDEIDFARVLDALGTRGFIRKYVIDGEEYGVIPTWPKHQVINNRESASDIPAPTETSYVSITSTREARVDDASSTRGKDEKEEGKGKEGNKEGETLCPGEAPERRIQEDDAAPPAGQPERRKAKQPSEEDYTCARKLFGISLSVNATAKKPNFDTWAGEVRLMREQDNRTHEAIEALFNWARHDAFWGPNIQSPGKLREKWDMLTERRRTPDRRGFGGAPSKFHGLNDVDRSGDIAAAQASAQRMGIDLSQLDPSDPINF